MGQTQRHTEGDLNQAANNDHLLNTKYYFKYPQPAKFYVEALLVTALDRPQKRQKGIVDFSYHQEKVFRPGGKGLRWDAKTSFHIPYSFVEIK